MDVEKKLNEMLGAGVPQVPIQERADIISKISPETVAAKIEKLLDALPEVEKAIGSITVKVLGQPKKTLTFQYR